MAKWLSLSASDVTTVLAQSSVKKIRPAHAMTQHSLHWRYCSYCGLLGLKNKATRKALRKNCVEYV